MNKKRKISHAAARRKGHQFERETAIRLRKIFPNAKRQLEYQEDQCNGVDIANTAHFKFQCKKFSQYVSINTIREIKCAEELGDVPVLVTAGDAQRAMAVLPFDDFLNLLHSALKIKRG